MITLLRKIRQRMLKQNNFGRYFLYAIGEILLVVVGILIALQINNWNQSQLDRVQEIEILEEIRQNILQDMRDHNQNFVNLNNIINASRIILDHLNNDRPYHDSLAFHFAYCPMGANFDAVKSGYELMLSKGVNIITNDSIRFQISLLYGNQYTWLRDFLKDRQYQQSQILFEDMMKKFRTFQLTKAAVPRNYEQLKQDDDFKVLIQQQGYINELTKGFYENILVGARKLIRDIEEEVNRLK